MKEPVDQREVKLCLYVFIVLFFSSSYTLTSVSVRNSVAEVLEKHGLQKPISYVKNSQNSEEEAHELMVKLCRHTGRKYELVHKVKH